MQLRYLYLIFLLLSACKVGPNYKRPLIELPDKFSEGGVDWHRVKYCNNVKKENWWDIFQDPILNELEEKLNNNNYNIQAAGSSYRQALALVDKAKTGYLPIINSLYSITKQKQINPAANSYKQALALANNTKNIHLSPLLQSIYNGLTSRGLVNINIPTLNAPPATIITNSHSLGLSASWELDLWGQVSRNMESAVASAKNSEANLELVKLSSQALLAQYYFELRMLDKTQELLDKIVNSYQEILDYTNRRYQIGIENQQAVILSQQQLQTAKITSINNNINRAQYQHAIAVLTGNMPINFNIEKNPHFVYPDIKVPISIPSSLLEDRADIRAAEHQIEIANAQLGIAKGAFFPSLSLAAAANLQGNGIKNLASLPVLLWSIGPQLALNLTNIVAYKATNKAAIENYNTSVALYRQIILTAFQDVEDNIAALKILDEQIKFQKEFCVMAKKNLDIVTKKINVGVGDQLDIVTAQAGYYSALKSLHDIEALKNTAAITLIKALGGIWK